MLLSLAVLGCSGGSGTAVGADLSGFRTAQITVGGVAFEVWLAETPAQQIQGLMFATPEQLAPLPDGTPRGMLFLFVGESTLSFWMRDTIVPLDLAYAKADGTIAEVHVLVPLDETRVESATPVQFALEVPAGTLADMGLGVGDTIDVPGS